jgi:hypothetical protein
VLCVALLALTSLTACENHAGAAAYVGKTRISETTVNRYLARDATFNTDPTTNAPDNPKSDVLTTLIRTALLDQVLRTLPGNHPTPGELDAGQKQAMSVLGITSIDTLVDEAEKTGYTKAYATLYLAEQTKVTVLSTLLKDPGDGSVVGPAVAKLHAKVSVSPRYGDWDATNLAVGTGPSLPSYLSLAADSGSSGNASG